MADRRNCGYAFVGPQTETVACLASIERSVRTIRKILIWWFVLSLIGVALFLVPEALR
jgi:hypothetical protein